MAIQFKKASKSQAKLKMAIEGPAGHGKSYSSLLIARGIVGPNGKIAVLDTEAGSANKYADLTPFDVVSIDSYHPDNYIEFIDEATKAGYDAVILDSYSHSWMGKGGVLEVVDQAAKRSKSGNSFAAWKEGTPVHDRLVEKILQSRVHVIATMRQKTEYVIEDVNGRKQPRKIGMGAVQREGAEFIFDIVGEFVGTAEMVITKTRYSPLADRVITKPGISLGQELQRWLSDGVPAIKPSPGVAEVGLMSLSSAELSESASLDELKSIWVRVMALHSTGVITSDIYSALADVKNTRKAELGG